MRPQRSKTIGPNIRRLVFEKEREAIRAFRPEKRQPTLAGLPQAPRTADTGRLAQSV